MGQTKKRPSKERVIEAIRAFIGVLLLLGGLIGWSLASAPSEETEESVSTERCPEAEPQR